MAKEEKSRGANPFGTLIQDKQRHPQEYYDRIKDRFAEERDVRLGYRPEGRAQFTTDLTENLLGVVTGKGVEERWVPR